MKNKEGNMLYTEDKERDKLFREHLVEFCKNKCKSYDCGRCYISQIYELIKKIENKEDK